MATKNLGQVSGVHIGNTPPSNTILIWYDSTPSQLRHKVYDPTLKQWVVLDQSIISAITYSELTNMAKNSGLSVGEYFQITDRSNVLALAIFDKLFLKSSLFDGQSQPYFSKQV